MGEYYAAPPYVYCLVEDGCEVTGPCKVGVATSLSGRLSSLQGGNWRPLKFVWHVQVPNRRVALAVEQRVLCRLRPSDYGGDKIKRRRLKSEWLDGSPADAYRAGSDLLEVLLEEEAA